MRLHLVGLQLVGISAATLTSAGRTAISQPTLSNRRAALSLAGSAALGVAFGGAAPALADEAVAAEEAVQVYFGCGCFWHVQHEFAEAEKKILGRKDSQLTALTGYAGGNAGAKNGKVCYHNAAMMSDYGSMPEYECARRLPFLRGSSNQRLHESRHGA